MRNTDPMVDVRLKITDLNCIEEKYWNVRCPQSVVDSGAKAVRQYAIDTDQGAPHLESEGPGAAHD